MKESKVPEDGALIEWITEVDHYDTMISGWGRIGTHRYWLIPDWAHGDEDCMVFDFADRHVKAKRLYRTYLFRYLVGWHWDSSPTKPFNRRHFVKNEANFKRFYSLPKEESDLKDVLVHIGYTKDMKTFIRKDTYEKV